MTFKRNFRGTFTFAPPATDKYREAYDRTFGKKKDEEKPETEPIDPDIIAPGSGGPMFYNDLTLPEVKEATVETESSEVREQRKD